MEKIKYFMMMALVALFSMTFTACEEDEETGEKQTADDVIMMGELTGYWLLDMIDDGEQAIIFEFNANKTVSSTLYDMTGGLYRGVDTDSKKWTVIGGKLVVTDSKGDKTRLNITFNSDKTKVTLTNNGSSLVLEKLADKNQAKFIIDYLLTCGVWYNSKDNDAICYTLKGNNMYFFTDLVISGNKVTQANYTNGTWKWEYDSNFWEKNGGLVREFSSITVTENTLKQTETGGQVYSYTRMSNEMANSLFDVAKYLSK